jgi:DNA replication protein DnaC
MLSSGVRLGPRVSDCSECGGAKYFSYSNLEIGHPFFGRLFPCLSCNKAEIGAASGLKDHERAVTLSNLITRGNRPGTSRMISAAQRFVEKPHGFLSIHGAFGNGKTTALMSIVNALIDAGTEARYLTAAELLAHLREAFNTSAPGVSDYSRLHELARVPVLCIDEMDKLRDTPYSREIQQELINLRYRDAGILGTVLAWNGDINALPFPAVISRAREFIVIENNDSDVRPAIGKAAEA